MRTDPELASADIVDLSYALDGDTIVEDYAPALARDVVGVLPWLVDEPQSGVLPLGGLARGEGIRFVGRRSRLTLRVPKARAQDARALVGRRLALEGDVIVGDCIEKAVGPSRVVHCAFVAMGTDDELAFLHACRAALDARGMAGELVCGRARHHGGPGVRVDGYSLMIYGLTAAQTVALQEQGLGEHRLLGCGHFIPHKNVAAVGSE